jgi:hypothetical protein
MSLKNKIMLASILISISALSAFYFSSAYKNKAPKNNILLSTFTPNGVIHREIKIDFAADSVENESETAQVYVKLKMPFDFDADLDYNWKLSEGVSLVEGEIKGQLKGLKKNESKTITISVKGFSKKINRQIGFEVFGTQNGRKIYGDILMASDKENTFEDIVQNVEKIKASK